MLVTSNRRHSPSIPRSSWTPRSANPNPAPRTRSRTLPVTRISPGPARAMVRAAAWTLTPLSFPSNTSHSPMWMPAGSRLRARASASAVAAAKLTAEAGESKRAKTPSPAVSSLPAAVFAQPFTDDPVMAREHLSPAPVAQLLRDLGRADDVREDERRQDVAGLVAPHERSLTLAVGRSNLGRRTLRGMPRDPNEPVRLTRIYTRGGDQGETSLGDGSRVSKLDPRVAAIGDVDELNSLVGWTGGLDRIQNELFDLGADLSVPFDGGRRAAPHHRRGGRPARAGDRRGERGAAGAEELRPARRERARCAPLPRACRLPPSRASRARGPGHESARCGLPQSALRPSLRPRTRRERRRRR